MRGVGFCFFGIWLFIVNVHQSFGVWDNEIEDYKKIVFFHEILHQVEKPLQYEEWKQRGDRLQLNKAFYKEYNEAMELLEQNVADNELLEHDKHFGELVKLHSIQAEGLFHFLFQALDWGTFVQNACWARQHINAHMFVYVFTMAAVQRQLDNTMLLPKIYEILPRYFLTKNFITETERFENSGWSTIKTENNFIAANGANMWQWWITEELIDQNWHAFDIENILNNDETLMTTYSNNNKKHQAWWHALDYTRNLKIMNEHSKLSYFTEDVDWNAYWYHLNVMMPIFLNGKDMIFWQNEIRRGEFWLYSLQQLLARYEMERLSHGFPETPKYEWHAIIEYGYDPLLIESNDKNFILRNNRESIEATVDSFEMLIESQHALEHIEKALRDGYYILQNGSTIDFHRIDSFEVVTNLLQCNIDSIDNYFDRRWYQLIMMYLAGTIDQKHYEVQPHALLNFETMLRDPLFYIFHNRIVDSFHRFRNVLPPYSTLELHTAGIRILTAHVSELQTFFDLYDLDASNLLQSNNTIYSANKILARQMRLTHKPFDFNLRIESERTMKGVLRIFLAPTNDVSGSLLSLDNERKNFLELNKILIYLKPGITNKTFRYEHYFSPPKNQRESFQSKLYFDALNPNKRWDLLKDYDPQRYCGLNTRLLLPRGSATGLPIQLFFMISQLDSKDKDIYPWWKLCVPLQGQRSFGFPFDRVIKNHEKFMAPNMYWKTVKIYHKETPLV